MSTVLSRVGGDGRSIKTSAFSRVRISASFVMPRTRDATRSERGDGHRALAAQAAPSRLIKMSLCRADKADASVSADLRSRYPVALVKARPSSSSSETMNFPAHKAIRLTTTYAAHISLTDMQQY